MIKMLLLLLSLLMPQYTIPSSTGATAGSLPAPLTWWKMNEGSGATFLDSSGNSNTAAFSPTIGAWGTNAGFPGSSFTFNGSGIGATATSTTLTNFSGTTPFSVSVWLNYSTSGWAIVSSLNASSNYTGWEIATGQSQQQVHGDLISNLGGSNYLEYYTLANTLPAGSLQHVVFTYSGNQNTSGITIYINGVATAITSSENSLTSSMANGLPLTIGARSAGNLQMVGTMADIRIWNVVLTQAQVTALYTAGPI